MAENQPQIDHYDFINAPQFVDFKNLSAQDDPDADKFFETHREEDDFMVPVDISAISPTVQLLYNDENEHYSNEANKAAIAAGLEDVKIEYYASPQQTSTSSHPSSANKKSLNSVYGTPLGASGLSSQASFYTPTGNGEDKENSTPSSLSGYGSVKKQGNSDKAHEKTPRNILSEHVHASSPTTFLSRCSNGSAKEFNNKNPVTAAQALKSQLEQLTIVSSDDEDEEDVSEFRLIKSSNSVAEASYETFTKNKLEYLGIFKPKVIEENHPSDVNNSVSETDETMVCNVTNTYVKNEEAQAEFTDDDSDSNSVERDAMEIREPVNNILQLLDAINLNDFDENPRSSILVANVGKEVLWNSDAVEEGAGCTKVEMSDSSPYSSLDFEINNSSCTVYRNRASSVGDLRQLLTTEVEPKSREFERYGYIPHVGITIPKTPDVAQRDELPLHVPLSVKEEQKVENFNSNENSCYFEIQAPQHKKSIRRVSSCGDLVKIQQRAELNTRNRTGRSVKPYNTKTLTVPKTPDAMKRSQKSKVTRSGTSSLSSSKCGLSIQSNPTTVKTGCVVQERSAATRSRQPVKGNHYVSMAEAMIKFHKNTPDRFRSLPKGRLVPVKRANSCDTRRKNDPSPAQSPESTFATSRLRADSCTERKEFNKTYSSRAAGGPVLPKKVELKPTIPKPFNLSSSHRSRATAVVPKEEDNVDFKFKARPVPSKVLHESTLLKVKPQVKVTLPMSPHFASDARLRERHQKRAQTKSPEAKLVKPTVKASRLPTPQRNMTDEHKTTVAQPFSASFDARQKETLRKKEEKIKQELEDAKKGREFHANPVPKFNAKLPKRKPVETTHVEPFKLKSDERGAAYQQALKRKLEEEEHQIKEQALFFAQPADVIYKAPFEPDLPARIIEVSEFQLATERRAAEREEFDEQIREKEQEEELRKKEEQEKLEELQKQEDIERRRQLVHRAQPFKAPKPFQLKSSAKPLTVPQSPAFSALPSERRIKSHNDSQSSDH